MTREEAIKYAEAMKAKVQERIEFFRLGHTHAPEVHYSDLAFLSAAISALREQEERQWIPVEERLPQNYISVLVYIPTAEPLPMVHEAYIGDDGEWHSSVFYGIENEDVTHWMPMPKTPVEDEK